MKYQSITIHAKFNYWVDIIRQQQASGMKINDWCKENNVSRHQYFYWKHRLKEACLESAVPDNVPLSLPQADQPESVSNTTCETCTTPATLTAIIHPENPTTYKSCTTRETLTTCDSRSMLKLTIDGIIIEVSDDTSDALLSRMIKEMKNA